jgi:apolipoprotein N-acyltransferase
MKTKYLYLLSVLSGIILSLGWPMNGFPFLLFVGFVPLLIVEDFLDRRREFFHKYSIVKFSFIAFFTWNLLTIYWIWNSTIAGGVMALLLNPMFMTIAFSAYHLSKRVFLNRTHAVYLLLFYWVAFEFVHLDWDLSFPWLNLGNGFAMYTKWVQWYEYTGILGGTFWIVLINILVFKLIQSFKKVSKFSFSVIFQGSVILLLIAVPMIISLVIYRNYEASGQEAEVIVTQPNVDPWSEQYDLPPSEVIERNLGLATPLLTPETEFIVCPESAIQEDIWLTSVDKSRSVKQIRSFISEHPNINILIGASSFRMFEEGEPLTQTARKFNDVDKYYEAFNTVMFLNAKEEIGTYHKSKLVPGPEKLPFQKVMTPLQNFVFDLGGTVGSLGSSPERTVFTSSDGKFKVPGIICYESIYGDFCAGFVRNGANLLFIITNDGWWGNTAGHRQHFTFAKLRAVETRRCVARSANTGISGFIDQRGDIIQKTEYWQPDVLKASLKANEELTVYVLWGDYFGRISAFLSVFLILISISFSITSKRKVSGKIIIW